jgi:hypothetical protein
MADRRAAGSVAATVVVLAAAGLAWFVCGVVWLVDFDDSDPDSARAGTSAVLLTITIVGALVVALAARDARLSRRVVYVGAVAAALPWLTAL